MTDTNAKILRVRDLRRMHAASCATRTTRFKWWLRHGPGAEFLASTRLMRESAPRLTDALRQKAGAPRR
jgi:hypothetical protein